MRRDFKNQEAREALGRVLRDKPFAGDGVLVLEALEAELARVDLRALEACALSAEWGRRRFALELIEIGREEFERASAQPTGDNGTRGFGRSGTYAVANTGTGSRRPRSRRRGPAGPFADALADKAD